MRPVRPTAVHKTDGLAELVCSNSFRGDKLDNAVGLLKEEMRRLGSLDHAGGRRGARAGGRRARGRSRRVLAARSPTPSRASAASRIVARRGPPCRCRRRGWSPVIIATGPLTSDALSADIRAFVGEDHLYFYDAISPIVLAEIDRHVEGVPRVAVGSEPAACRCRTECADRCGREPAPACGVTTGKATI